MITTEEKAKAYDEALERAKTLYENANGMILKKWVEQVFPELAESEDEKIRKEIVRFIRMEVEDEIVGNKWLAWLGKQKGNIGGISSNSEWSKEDETGLTNTIIMLKEGASLHFIEEDITKAVVWLQSIKDRVQPKQEWGEEDEHRIKDTVYFLDTAKKHYASTEELDACIAWLESLKGRVRPQWKPSDNELEVLRLVAEKDGTCLMGLYEQLKKLKED